MPRRMNEDSGENFLSRWSRRKRQIQTGGDAAGEDLATLDKGDAGAAVAPRNGKPAAGQPAPLAEQAEHEAPAGEAGLAGDEGGQPGGKSDGPRDFSDVDFDKLDFESDYTTFMEKDVPDDVRNLALRKLWASNPVLTFMDGLDDYCEDYTDAAVCMPVGTMKTAYKFGRGFLSDEEVAEWEALGKPEEQVSDEQQDGIDKDNAPLDAKPQSDTVVADAETTADGTDNVAGIGADDAGDAQANAPSERGAVGDPSVAGTSPSDTAANEPVPVSRKA